MDFNMEGLSKFQLQVIRIEVTREDNMELKGLGIHKGNFLYYSMCLPFLQRKATKKIIKKFKEISKALIKED